MKALGIVVLNKKIFENCILKTYFFTYLYNQLQRFEKTLVEEHPGIIPLKFGQTPMSGFREVYV